jgi:hypothetical protein
MDGIVMVRLTLMAMVAGLALIAFDGKAQTPREPTIYVTGNQFLELCNMSEVGCLEYVVGALDDLAIHLVSQHRLTCMPAGAAGVQMKDVVLNYIRAHPEHRQGRLPCSC